MLRVRVEIVPYGVEEGAHDILTVYIGNDGSGNHSIGHYDVYVEDPRGQARPRSSRRGWIGKILWFPRRGADRNRIRLAQRALALAVARAVED